VATVQNGVNGNYEIPFAFFNTLATRKEKIIKLTKNVVEKNLKFLMQFLLLLLNPLSR